MTKQAVGTVAANTQPGARYGNFGGKPAPSLYNWFPEVDAGQFHRSDVPGRLERHRQLRVHLARR